MESRSRSSQRNRPHFHEERKEQHYSHHSSRKEESIVDTRDFAFKYTSLRANHDFVSTRNQQNPWNAIHQTIQRSAFYGALKKKAATANTINQEIEKLRKLQDDYKNQFVSLQKELAATFDDIDSLYKTHLSSKEKADYDYVSKHKKNNLRNLQEQIYRYDLSPSERDEIKSLNTRKSNLLNEKAELEQKKRKVSQEINALQAKLKENKDNKDLKKYFDHFGNVWLKDHTQYFANTELSKTCARNFLVAMFEDREMHESLLAKQKEKVGRTKLPRLSPCNISFVTCKINGKYCCFIALSRANMEHQDRDDLSDLDKFAKRYNEKNHPDIPYCVIRYSSQNHHDLIKKVVTESGDQYTKRNCSEYDYGAVITKLVYEYNDIWIEGVTNCDLYPYKHGVKYGNEAHSNSPESLVNPPHLDNIIIDDPHYILPTKPCCNACQTNWDAHMATWAGIQEYVQQSKEIVNNIPPVSPIRELRDDRSSISLFFSSQKKSVAEESKKRCRNDEVMHPEEDHRKKLKTR